MASDIHSNIAELIGDTPMVRLGALSPEGGASILAKLEYLNPGGSVKDRIALSMIRDAEEAGRLKSGVAIVEATSGNTGIGLAMLCAELDYRLILTMPETMSFERRALVTRFGAEVVLTPGDEDIPGAVARARQIVDKNPNCIELRQFENPANPRVHRETTGPELWRATDGDIAAFVVGVGPGGTITGAGEVLKAAIPDIQIVAVEPASSAVLPDVTFHMTERFLFGAGDRRVELVDVPGVSSRWLITAAMAGVGLITEFRALKTGGVRPFALGVACTVIIGVAGLIARRCGTAIERRSALSVH